MTGMSRYYVSRALVSAACSGLLALTGSPWWIAAGVGVIAFAFFLWAPHSGRYAVHPEFGVTALQRDERTQAINDHAARNAFVVTMLAGAATAIYFGTVAHSSIPVMVLDRILALGAVSYFLSDLWLRRP